MPIFLKLLLCTLPGSMNRNKSCLERGQLSIRSFFTAVCTTGRDVGACVGAAERPEQQNGVTAADGSCRQPSASGNQRPTQPCCSFPAANESLPCSSIAAGQQQQVSGGQSLDSSKEEAEGERQQDSSGPQLSNAGGSHEEDGPACQEQLHADNEGITAYELARLERIRRNQEVMRAMGLGGPSEQQQQQQRILPARKRKIKQLPAPSAPLRRSARHVGSKAAKHAATEAAAAPAATAIVVEDEFPQVYDDSSVARYVCKVLSDSGAPAAIAASMAPCPNSHISGFAQLPGCLADSALTQAYGLDWRPGLVIAGGKGGVVSVWGSAELEAGSLLPDNGSGAELLPLLSFKAHRGWVADVQWLRGSSGSSSCAGSGAAADSQMLFLSSSNDGSVCLWDAGKAAGAGRSYAPQQLAEAAPHLGGIFSMAEACGRIATGSKDCCVAVTELRPDGSLAMGHRYDELHEHVVKCVRWQPGSGSSGAVMFASCGNDRRLCIVDTRTGGASSLTIPNAADSVVNTLRWSPADPHLLLTASHDPAVVLHDLRRPGQPLHRLLGHSPLTR